MPTCFNNYRWILLPCGIVLFGSGGLILADDWPQWRGLSGQGIARDKGLPVRWDVSSKNIRWKTPIPGEGVSSPVVSAGQVYLTTAYAGEQPKPYDMAAAWLAMSLAAGVGVLLIVQLGKAWRFLLAPLAGSNRQRRWVVALMAHTVMAVALLTAMLAKPGWCWPLPDPWTGWQVAAEVPFVESFHLRAALVLFTGSLAPVFQWLALRGRPQTAPSSCGVPNAIPLLAWWMKALTAVCTMSVIIAIGLVVCRSDWFLRAGQPGLTWLFTGRLGGFGV